MSSITAPEIPTRPTTYFEYITEFESIYPLQVDPRISDNVLNDDEFKGQVPFPLYHVAAKNVVQGLQVLSIPDATWGTLLGTSSVAIRGIVRTVAHVSQALDNISRPSSIWRNANLSRAEERTTSVNIADASENLFEIRRLTGFSWPQLANLLDVTRYTLNKWVKGAEIKGKNRKHVAETLKVLRYADKGSAESNAEELNKQNESQKSPIELIRLKDYEVAKQLLSYGPSRPQRRLTDTDTATWIGEFQPLLIHPNADGTEKVETLHHVPEPVSRKRTITRG